jgi:hypothetical protein
MASYTLETAAAAPETRAAAPAAPTPPAPDEPLLLPAASATPASYPAGDPRAEVKKPATAAPAATAPVIAPATNEKEKAAPPPNPQVEALNVLLRGELAAIETYTQAIEKAGKESGVEELEALQRDHREASGALWQHIQRHGGEPVKSAGAWGTVAKALEGAAKLFGNVTALAMLKEGEAHGAGLYRDALDHPELGADCLDVVRPLLAKQQEHVTALEGLIARAGGGGAPAAH